MMEQIEHSRMAIDELINVMGRASIEAVLQLSAAQVADRLGLSEERRDELRAGRNSPDRADAGRK
jgi:hypothetical protein